ncbi:MAG: DUF1571 domain-containing protein [Planctomycetota bacterium]|nr:DUF1571 domain-containing protein [Planctomycetota bacterium]
MARQGYRVWLTRLTVLTLCGCILVGVFGVGWRMIWNRWADETLRPVTSKDLVSPKAEVESTNSNPHAIDPLLEFARRALAHHCSKHQDFTANLTKRERVAGKLLPASKMQMKLRYGSEDPTAERTVAERTVSVYLKGIEPKSQAGREIIWVQNKNNNKLTAHEAGLLGLVTVELSPQSSLAMLGNRYPITEIGIEKLLRKLIEKGERDRLLGPVTVRRTENATLGKLQCTLLEVIHEEPTVEIDGKQVEFEFYLAQIYIDEERLVPLKYASYTWPKTKGGEPELEEEYTYEDLLINVGLTDADFEPKNPNYHF